MDQRPRSRLSLDLLRSFQAAARHLSFTRAARELSLTQPAISHGIKTLEEQLGAPLFHRANRELRLTEAGEEMYRAAAEALGVIDAAAERVAGLGQTLSVTTTTALASLWLVPRLPRFTKRHPGIDVRVAATYEPVNLEREHIDVAIRYVPPGGDVPHGEWLCGYEIFPVCSPQLARSRACPLRKPADLGQHVRLDFERIAFGGVWSDWEHWFEGMGMRAIKPVGTLHCSHYDHVIQGAIEGSGVAIGKRPHLTHHLRGGVLRAPFGREGVVGLGGFYLVVARGSVGREPVASFAGWVKEQVREDAE